MRLKLELDNRNSFCIVTVTNISILLFFLCTIGYSYFVYQQFTFFEIVKTSIAFFILLIILDYLTIRTLCSQRILLNKKYICISIFVAFFLLLMSTSFSGVWVDVYYRTFPLHEVEFGLGWHKDTVFHVSIIQSILNFGYPSTAQDGTPLLFYHVLSHYIDAIILFIVDLEPLDSYGLFKSFKIFLFLSVSAMFVGRVSANKVLLFLLGILTFVPILVGTWHVVGSHGLWVTSLILVLTSPIVFDFVRANKRYPSRYFLTLFALIIILSLGKISTGFMYAVFIGSYLLVKNHDDYRIYLLGAFWLFFFYLYSQLMSNGYSINLELDMSLISTKSFYQYFFNPSRYLSPALISFFVGGLIYNIYRDRDSLIFLISSGFSLLVLYIITISMKGFSRPDIAYFQLGLSSVLTLFAIISICIKFKAMSLYENYVSSLFTKGWIVSVLIGSILLSGTVFNQNYTLFDIDLYNIKERIMYANKGLFKMINKSQGNREEMSINRVVLNPMLRSECCKGKGYLSEYRRTLYALLDNNELNKKDVLMFIPDEVYKSTPDRYGEKWDYGMLIYSVTGIPLVKAVKEQVLGYGYGVYDENSFRVKSEQFNHNISCREHNVKSIIMVESLYPAYMKLLNCDEI